MTTQGTPIALLNPRNDALVAEDVATVHRGRWVFEWFQTDSATIRVGSGSFLGVRWIWWSW